MISNDKNISCWNCDHFQRYERGPNPQSCAGECRFSLPGVFKWLLINNVDTWRIEYWPVYDEAYRYWCGRYQRTREKNLPPEPPHNEGFCVHSFQPLEEVLSFWENPWNKKILSGYVDKPQNGISCFNCDHYQILDPDFSLVAGECRARPVPPFEMVFENSIVGFQMTFPYEAWSSPCSWCAQWERANRRTLPQIDWDNICQNPLQMKGLGVSEFRRKLLEAKRRKDV